MTNTLKFLKIPGTFLAYFILIIAFSLPNGLQTRLSTPLEEPLCQQVKRENSVRPLDCGKSIFAYSTADDYLAQYGGLDMASYVKGALQIVDNNLLLSPKLAGWKLREYGYGMWAPGIFILNAIPLTLNRDFPLGAFHAVLAATLWAVAFTSVTVLLLTRLPVFFAIAIPLSVFSLPLFSNYFFRHGVVLIESISTALLITSMTLLIRCFLLRSSLSVWLVSGLFMFGATFIRSQIFLMAIVLSTFLSILLLLDVFKKYPQLSNLRFFGVIAYILIIWIPIGLWMFWNEGKLFDVSYAYKQAFLLNPYQDFATSNFLTVGGFASACAADMDNCERVRMLINSAMPISDKEIAKEILSAFIHYPVSFLAYKLPIAWRYWNEASQYLAVVYMRSEFVLSTLFIIFGLIGFYRLIVSRQWVVFSLCFICLVFSVIPMMVFHFEVRYLFLTKALSFFILVWSCVTYRYPRDEIST